MLEGREGEEVEIVGRKLSCPRVKDLEQLDALEIRSFHLEAESTHLSASSDLSYQVINANVRDAE